eukprot:1634065-Pyramimonas_sp.AAC.1
MHAVALPGTVTSTCAWRSTLRSCSLVGSSSPPPASASAARDSIPNRHARMKDCVPVLLLLSMIVLWGSPPDTPARTLLSIQDETRLGT